MALNDDEYISDSNDSKALNESIDKLLAAGVQSKTIEGLEAEVETITFMLEAADHNLVRISWDEYKRLSNMKQYCHYQILKLKDFEERHNESIELFHKLVDPMIDGL